MRVWLKRVVAAAKPAARLALAAALGTALAGAQADASDFARAYDFAVTWSVFPDNALATGVLRFDETKEHYSIALDASARLTVPPIDWRGVFETKGDFAGARSPQRFARSSIRPDARETVTVTWSAAAATPVTTTQREPAGAVVDREPVDASQIFDVVDPLSFAGLIYDAVRVSDGQNCEVAAKTWDGARLAQMVVSTADSVRGSRVDCRLTYSAISGLRRDTPWRSSELETDRIIRFEKKIGEWRPVLIRITGVFLGIESSFTTTFSPREAG